MKIRGLFEAHPTVSGLHSLEDIAMLPDRPRAEPGSVAWSQRQRWT
jgi:hypothetical protein